MSTGSARLNHAVKTLRERWDDTQENWHDVVEHKFTEDVREPLEQRVKAALSAIDRLALVIARSKQDCG